MTIAAQGTSHASAFARDGYVIVEDLFTRAEMEQAKRECQRVLAAKGHASDGNNADRTKNQDNGVNVGLAGHSDVIRSLHGDARIVDILADIIGPNIEFWSDKAVYKSAVVDYGSPWHQDWPYWRGAHKYSVWMALDDATPENGCLKLVPGTHASLLTHGWNDAEGIGFWNRMRPEDVDEGKAVVASIRAGSVIVFHDLALHSSFPNTSGKDRWCIISTYRDGSADDYEYGFAKANFMARGKWIGKSLGAPPQEA
ncbi:MAG: phytanoyl-CoA dioxygenase family protein [Planctomycetes bacterium]|nr:phytanoyl-CoA dioxygenase family protein [Planctomycetota bacterium]